MKRDLPLILVAFFLITTAAGQKLDLSYHQPLPLRAAYINAIAVQPDGKILLGGDIKFYGTQRVHNLIRLQADGSLDESFSFDGEDDLIISNLALLPSGEIVALSVSYDSYNDMLRSTGGSLMKLNADGSLIKQISAQSAFGVFAVDALGRVLIATDELIRYNADLTLDDTFQAFNADGSVTAVAFTGDKILVAGSFSSVQGVAKQDIVRLNDDGSLDSGFDTGDGTSDYIGSLTVQPDGKILLGNSYINSFDGVMAGGLMRLNADGSVDTEFKPPLLNGPVSQVIAIESAVYVAAFLYDGQEASDRLFRLNPDNGELDPGFPPALLDDFGAISLRMAISGDQIIANNTQIKGNVFGLSRFNSNGTYDDAFRPDVGRYGTIKLADFHQGKMLVAGDFIRMNGVESYGIARLNLNGELDESFRLKENKGVVYQLKVLDGDDVLVTTYKNFFKLDADGSERPDFSWAPFKYQYEVVKFKVLDEGKIMSADANLIYRLNADGSEDPTFDIEDICCVRSTAFDFDVQGENVIWGSEFSAVGAVAANRLARLTPGADVDVSFNTGAGPNGNVSLVKVLDNNEIIVGGFFDQFDEKPVTLPLVKLSPNGTLDMTFYNNLQSNPALPYDIIFSRKVEQLGSTVYFQHRNGIYAVGVDGKVHNNFNIPAVVSAVSDIITITDGPGNGRQKSSTAMMYALGNFAVEGNASPLFLLKMDVDVNPSTPSEVTTGIGDNAEPSSPFSLHLYPQPARDNLRLHIGGSSGTYRAEVFDMAGRRLLETVVDLRPSAADPEVELHNAPPGLYLMKVISENGRYTYAKFVKDQ